MLVATLPLVLVFLFAVLDLGRAVFVHAELENAAASVCRGIETRAIAAGQQAIVDAACAAAPSLGSDSLGLSAEVRFGELEERSYTHRLYDRVSDGFSARASQTRARPFEVVLQAKGDYLTPVGLALSAAAGQAGGAFCFAARAVGVVDETVEGGAW